MPKLIIYRLPLTLLLLALLLLLCFYFSFRVSAQDNPADLIPSDLALDIQVGQANPAPEQADTLKAEVPEANVATSTGSQPAVTEDAVAPETAKENKTQALNSNLVNSEQAVQINEPNGDNHNVNDSPGPTSSGDQPSGSNSPASPGSDNTGNGNPTQQPSKDLNVTNPAAAPDDNLSSPSPAPDTGSGTDTSSQGSSGDSSSSDNTSSDTSSSSSDQQPSQ